MTRLWADAPTVSAKDPIPWPTLGGKQFWADEFFFHQWHIQRNTRSGLCRLLDESDFRHASGTYEQCRAVLDQIKIERKLPPMRGRAVLLLHGLGRSRSSMDKLAQTLKGQGGYNVFTVGYPSTQREIGDHARTLKHILDNLDGIEEINLVAHSMGNIVIRHYLADQTDRATGRRPDPRIRRFVMLGPPNHQSHLALMAADIGLFQWVAGEAGQQLGRDWDHLEGKLATPEFEFGILAGGKGDAKGFNPLIPGDNDRVVSVAGTRLAGAADFLVVPVAHTFMMDDPNVMEYTLRFLQKGYFVSPQKRQPIPK